MQMYIRLMSTGISRTLSFRSNVLLQTNAADNQLCIRRTGPDLQQTCNASCGLACTAALNEYADRDSRLTGYSIDAKTKDKLSRSCTKQCTYECAKPGDKYGFAIPYRSREWWLSSSKKYCYSKFSRCDSWHQTMYLMPCMVDVPYDIWNVIWYCLQKRSCIFVGTVQCFDNDNGQWYYAAEHCCPLYIAIIFIGTALAGQTQHQNRFKVVVLSVSQWKCWWHTHKFFLIEHSMSRWHTVRCWLLTMAVFWSVCIWFSACIWMTADESLIVSHKTSRWGHRPVVHKLTGEIMCYPMRNSLSNADTQYSQYSQYSGRTEVLPNCMLWLTHYQTALNTVQTIMLTLEDLSPYTSGLSAVDALLQERIVDVTSIIAGVKCVPVVFVEFGMLPETFRKIGVGQVMSAKADQVCMVQLQALDCSLPVVPTCMSVSPLSRWTWCPILTQMFGHNGVWAVFGEIQLLTSWWHAHELITKQMVLLSAVVQLRKNSPETVQW